MLGQGELVHGQAQAVVGVRQDLHRHVVATDGGDALVDQPFRGGDVDTRLAAEVFGVVHREITAPAGANQGHVAGLDGEGGFMGTAGEVVRRDDAAGVEVFVAVQAGDVEDQAARNDRRGVFDAELGQAPVGHDFRRAEAVEQEIAGRKMPERIDVGAGVHGHLDTFEIGAGVVAESGGAAAFDAVLPGCPDGHQIGGLVGRHIGGAHVDFMTQVVDAALLYGSERGEALFGREKVAGAELIGGAPFGVAELEVFLDRVWHGDIPLLALACHWFRVRRNVQGDLNHDSP